MKILNGSEVAGFVKERQAAEVRSLKQGKKVFPKLAIIRTNPAPIVDTYLRLKQNYGTDIGVEVAVVDAEQSAAPAKIKELNDDESVHGVIIQLPLPDMEEADKILNSVASEKDVDGLRDKSVFDAPTPTAINWLLAAHNIELAGKKIVVVGQGRLVGAPLTEMWRSSGYDIETADITTARLDEQVRRGDVIVTATGVPGLIKSSMIKEGAVVVDAGVATDANGLAGDVSGDARTRNDITITPEKGGVGPLTVAALFENVILSARRSQTQ